MQLGSALATALEVVRVLRELSIDHLVGGSVASSLHGIPRSTQDVDLVAALKPAHVPLLVGRLQESFYVDGERARQAVRSRSSFNLIHLKTMLKIDVFVLGNDPLEREEMRRRQRFVVDEGAGETIDVASPEDVVLQKLAWYRRGGEVSDRQWQDLLGVLKVQKALDHDYLERWSRHLEAHDLYLRALRDSG